MSNLVIVAIPDENDRVWKVSSEKVPHLTLLFLGDVDKVSNTDQIVQFVEHAANTTLKRFYLPVDRRGELGADKADVLFFKKGRYDYKAIRDFRAVLLKDNNIKTAYDGATQFDGPWNPHLTLGYPETPAKPDDTDRDFGFYDVAFNKIAVWMGDFEGPDFLLKDYWDEFDALETVPMDVAMSGILHHGEDEYTQNLAMGAAFLAHSGVKGMRWGVRKSDASISISSRTGLARASTGTIVSVLSVGPLAFAIPRVRQELKEAGAHNRGVQAAKKQDKKDKKADSKWEKQIYTEKGTVDLHNAMADHFNKHIDALNAKPDYKDLNLFTHPDREDAVKYMKEADALTHASYKEGVKSVFGTSPSGKKRAELGDDGVIKMVDTDKVKHAAEDDAVIGFLLKRDANGKILEMNQAEAAKTAAHSAEIGAEFILEHFGVKGMRWGMRKEDLASVGNAAKSAGGKVGRAANAVGKGILDVNFEDRVKDPERHEMVQHAIIDKANTAFKRTDLPAIKDKPEYQKAKKLPNRLRHPLDPATKAYRKEVKTAYIKRLEDAANTMTNASGTRQYTIRERGWELPAEGGALPKSKNYWDVTSREIKHAVSDGDITTAVEVILDDDGFITDLKPISAANALAQTMDLGADFLEHYGVKGMRWGVSREAPSAVAPTAMSVVPHGTKRRTKVEVAGGENHPAHEDALKVAEARAKLKRSGTAALSNQELQTMAKRLQLETQVAQLTSSRGQKFIQRQLEQQGQQTIQTGFRKGGAHVVKKGAKKAGKAAATTAVTLALM